jgi:hypothetical protein
MNKTRSEKSAARRRRCAGFVRSRTRVTRAPCGTTCLEASRSELFENSFQIPFTVTNTCDFQPWTRTIYDHV